METNELVQFLEGRWLNTSVEVDLDQPMQKKTLLERRKKKGLDTITITSRDQATGQEMIKDMQLIVRGKEIKLRQGSFMATGSRQGNMYLLSGRLDDKEYIFRLYMMEDKFIFHREIWLDGHVQHVDISCLERPYGTA